MQNALDCRAAFSMRTASPLAPNNDCRDLWANGADFCRFLSLTLRRSVADSYANAEFYETRVERRRI